MHLLDYTDNPITNTSPEDELATAQQSFRFTTNDSYERVLMKLTGRTILITGGSAGIGLAIALKILELGNEVIVTGRRQAVLDQV